MKKLTREERKGAIALALMVIVVLFSALLFKTCIKSNDDLPEVKIIHTDSADKKDNHKTRKYKKKRKSGKKSTTKKEKTGSHQDNMIQRDFLSDTIPVKQTED